MVLKEEKNSKLALEYINNRNKNTLKRLNNWKQRQKIVMIKNKNIN